MAKMDLNAKTSSERRTTCKHVRKIQEKESTWNR